MLKWSIHISIVCLNLLIITTSANCRKLSQTTFSCKRERILHERIRQEGDENWRIILRIRDRNESIPSISNRSIVVSVKGSCSRTCLRTLRHLSIRYSIPWYWISFLSSSTARLQLQYLTTVRFYPGVFPFFFSRLSMFRYLTDQMAGKNICKIVLSNDRIPTKLASFQYHKFW